MNETLLFALALQVAQAVTPPPALPLQPAGGVDWDRLVPLPWRAPPQLTADLSQFVRDEIAARRCIPPMRGDRRPAIDVDVAVLVRADGSVRVTVPRAIDCPSVEQFTAGLVTSFARNNLRTTPEGWYRASVSFAISDDAHRR